MNNFPTFIDRMGQGYLNQMVLGRLMLADNGLVTEPAFWFADGTPLIDNSELVYDGNSQGGIMGMALAGMSQDFDRAVLGVVGHELLDAAPPLDRLRRVRGDLHPVVPEQPRPHAAAVGHPDGVGPGRGLRLRPPHRRQPAARTRRRSRC